MADWDDKNSLMLGGSVGGGSSLLELGVGVQKGDVLTFMTFLN